ncbi:MAG: tRNA (adenosine(37)-N6)-threonylcarbamoyltransferase complex ATPase subunit type 1 TsaE [Firmicutes bacterium]|nr:tRNA (adenosine(37)-N6)-threonylcarbamoyltransferase complex ATPase subunit type 1 TsaE [Bacillota bacterium]
MIRLDGEAATKEYGYRLAEEAVPGQVIALIGDLGAGKTTLTKYIAEGLGVTEHVQSPTFTIVREYHSGRMPLYHFDVYRIDDPDEMFEIGYEEYFYGDGLCVVEWADKIEELLPEGTRIIRLSYGGAEEERIVENED